MSLIIFCLLSFLVKIGLSSEFLKAGVVSLALMASQTTANIANYALGYAKDDLGCEEF